MTIDRLDQISDLTRSLIRFQSVHDQPDEIQACADFVESYLHRSGARVRRVKQGNSPSLLVLPRNDHAPVLLMSHIDVVAADPAQFEPYEKEGSLYGRGSLDDKYAVALSLVLFEKHLSEMRRQGKSQQDLPFGLLITSDEEMGGFHGAGRILPTLATDFVILLDGGSPDKVVVKQKGFAKLRLVSKGKSAHGSQPWLGENAIDQLVDDYLKLRGLFKQEHPEHWHRTANLSILHSGRPGQAESFNQVPERAEAVLDVRWTEQDDLEALIARLRQEVRSEVIVEASGPIFDGGESAYLDRLLEIVPGARPSFTHSASDARFLTQYGIPGIVWGADGDDSAHSAYEHVDLESANRLYGMLDAFLLALREVAPRGPGDTS